MILITRPHEEAKVLEKEFLHIGKECVIDSLLNFKLHYKKIPIEKKVLYLISSSQAVKALTKYKDKHHQLLTNGEFIIVGKKVSTELKKISPIQIKKVTKDSDDMKKFLISQWRTKNYKKIVFISGSVFNREFVSNLTKKQIVVKRKVLYTTLQTKNFKQKTIRLFNHGKITHVVFYSSFTAEVFLKLLKMNALEKKVRDIIPVSLSKRIDAILEKSQLFNKTLISRKPNESSLIKKIIAKKL